jgi:hypothetical protein
MTIGLLTCLESSPHNSAHVCEICTARWQPQQCPRLLCTPPNRARKRERESEREGVRERERERVREKERERENEREIRDGCKYIYREK